MSADDPTPAEPVRILTVCTGNICRSPYAAALLREGLQGARPGVFEVTSAGTHALVGRPMEPAAVTRLGALGLADDAFRARLLTHRLLLDAAVVLVMASEHRDVVIDETPAAHRRVFTVRELAHLLEEVGRSHDWRRLLAEAGADDAASRWRLLPQVLAGHRRRMGRGDRDVADPYQRGDRAFELMSRQIDPAVRTIVRWEAQFER
jgi:protein-tyrosine phosphatase